MDSPTFTTLVSIALGIGLAASAGFRIFLPLFALSLSAHFQLWPVNESWQWLGSTPALVILGAATLAEICAYLVPFVDNLLDTLAVPLAGLAGTAVMVSTTAGLSPEITWALAVIAGGGAAAAVKSTAAATRAVSTAGTGGLGNPVLSAAETGTAAAMSALSLFLPFAAAAAVLLLAAALWFALRRLRRKTAARTPAA